MAYQIVDGLVNGSPVTRWKSLQLKGCRFGEFDVACSVRIKHNDCIHPERQKAIGLLCGVHSRLTDDFLESPIPKGFFNLINSVTVRQCAREV